MSSRVISLSPLVDMTEAQTISLQGLAIDFLKHGLGLDWRDGAGVLRIDNQEPEEEDNDEIILSHE